MDISRRDSSHNESQPETTYSKYKEKKNKHYQDISRAKKDLSGESSNKLQKEIEKPTNDDIHQIAPNNTPIDWLINSINREGLSNHRKLKLDAVRIFSTAYNDLKYACAQLFPLYKLFYQALHQHNAKLQDKQILSSMKMEDVKGIQKDFMALQQQINALTSDPRLPEDAQKKAFLIFAQEQKLKLERAITKMKRAGGQKLGKDDKQSSEDTNTKLTIMKKLGDDGRKALKNMEFLLKHIVSQGDTLVQEAANDFKENMLPLLTDPENSDQPTVASTLGDALQQLSDIIQEHGQAKSRLNQEITDAHIQLRTIREHRNVYSNETVNKHWHETLDKYWKVLGTATSYAVKDDATTIDGLREQAEALGNYRILLEKLKKSLDNAFKNHYIQLIDALKAGRTNLLAYYERDIVRQLGDQPKTGDFDPEVLRVAHNLIKDLLVGETPLTTAIQMADQHIKTGIAVPEELAQYTAELKKGNIRVSELLKRVNEQLEQGISHYVDKIEDQNRQIETYFQDKKSTEVLQLHYEELIQSTQNITNEAIQLQTTLKDDIGKPEGALVDLQKMTDCFENLAIISETLGENLKALDIEVVASNWDEVRLLEMSGKNVKQYNDKVTGLRPHIEEMKALLADQTDDRKNQLSAQYMRECKNSISDLYKLIYTYGDTIEVFDIFMEYDTKIGVIKNINSALRAQKDLIQIMRETDAHWGASSPEVRSQMETYFARCLKSLENYHLELDQFFEDQQTESKKISNIDADTKVNTKLHTIYNNMVNMNAEMRRALNILTLKEKYPDAQARSNIAEDDLKALEIYEADSKRYWEYIAFYVDKKSIDCFFEDDHHFSPQVLLDDTFKQHTYLKERYESGIGFWDGRTCGKHAEIKLTLFESCYGKEPWTSSLLTKNEFRLLLALRDIGRAEAFNVNQNPSQTNECTHRILPQILQWLDIPKEKSEIILSLATQDYLREYIHIGPTPGVPELYAKHLSSEAARLDIDTQEYFHLSTLFYLCDAGSESDGGRKGPDWRFAFHYDSNDQLTKMDFSQQAKESFQKLVDRIADGPDYSVLNLDWVGDTQIAVGGSFSSSQIQGLLDRRIMNVIDVRAEMHDNEQDLARKGINWLHLPVPDRHALSVEQLVEGVKWILACREREERVLIHCEFGMGRSVLLTAAALVAQGMTANQALDFVPRYRKIANPTPPQRARLQEFEDHWKQLQIGSVDAAYQKMSNYVTEPARRLILYTLQQGNLDQALTYTQQALSLREAAHSRFYLPLDHLLLSTIYQAKGKTIDALSHVQRASAIASEMGIEAAVTLANKQLESVNKKLVWEISHYGNKIEGQNRQIASYLQDKNLTEALQLHCEGSIQSAQNIMDEAIQLQKTLQDTLGKPEGTLELSREDLQKMTDCFEQLAKISQTLGENLKALDLAVISNWDEVRLLEVPGKNAKDYNQKVTDLRSQIEELKAFLSAQTDDRKNQLSTHYMRACKDSILSLYKLINTYEDTIVIFDIFMEYDTKSSVIQTIKNALSAQQELMRIKQEADARWAQCSPTVQSQMETYFARCLKSLESYQLDLDQFFEDQHPESTKIANIDADTKVNTKLPTLSNNIVNMNAEMRRALNLLTLREKYPDAQARSTLSDDDQQALAMYETDSQRYWEYTEFYVDKKRIDRVLEDSHPFSPQMLLDTFKHHAYLQERYESGIGVWDGRTCQEHAETKLTLFERCYGKEAWTSSLLTQNEFRLLLALSNIGQAEAFNVSRDLSQTNACTRRILSKIFHWLEIPEEKHEIILSLVTQEYLREYIYYGAAPGVHETYAKHLSSEAARLGIDTQAYFHLATRFYLCDEGSSSAGGSKGPDWRFTFHSDSHGQLTGMDFSPQGKDVFQKLVDRIADGQDHTTLNLDWVGDTQIAVGGSFSSSQIQGLLDRRIMNVIDVRAEMHDNEQDLARKGINWLHLPVPDRHALSVEQLVEGVKWILACREREERVLIHCEFGVGRSVLLTAAALVAQGMTANQALDFVPRYRKIANPTPPQRARLQEFEDHWKQLQIGSVDAAYQKMSNYVTEPARRLILYTLQQGNLDQALTYTQQALSLREAAHSRFYLPLDHLLLSTIYQAKGKTIDALSHVQRASAIASEMGIEAAVTLANKQLENINEKDGYQTFSLNEIRRFITTYNDLKNICDDFYPISQSFDKDISDLEKLPSLEILEYMHKDLMELKEQVKMLRPSDKAPQEGAQEKSLTTLTLEQTQKLEKAIKDMKDSKAKTLGNDGKQLLGNIETLLEANGLPKSTIFSNDVEQLLNNIEDLFEHIVQKRDRLETVSDWISDSMQAHLDLGNVIESADTQLRPILKDRFFFFDENVRKYQEDLEAARSYKNQSETTINGLKEQALTLEAHWTQLDNALEERTKQEVKKWSNNVGDVRHVQLEYPMIGTIQVADVLYPERVAKAFNMALQGGEPEDIYRELHALQWQQEAVDKADMAHQRIFSETLETALKDRLQEVQLEHALQYINKGKLIEPLPLSLEDLAIHLNAEFAMPTIEPEKIYAIFVRFRRNRALLCWLDEVYKEKFGKSVKAEIEEKLEGKSKDYANGLIGGDIGKNARRTLREVVHLYKGLLEMPIDLDGVSFPLLYDIPLGNEAWADWMCQELKRIGIDTKKCFALSIRKNNSGQFQGNLHIHTNFAPDMPPGQEPTVSIQSRVVSIIEVETPFGLRELVLESDGLLTVKEWMSKMGQDAFERISFEEYKAKLDVGAQLNPNFPYPTDKTYVFSTIPNYFYLPTRDTITSLEAQSMAIPDSSALSIYNTTGKKLFIDNIDRAPFYGIAEFIRRKKQSMHSTASAEHAFDEMVEELFNKVRTFGFSFIRHTAFSTVFPNLYQDLKTHLAEANVSASIVERFESLLSSKSILLEAHRNQDGFPTDSIHDTASDMSMQRELIEAFEQAKNEYITKNASKVFDRTKKIADSYSVTHANEIVEIKKYFDICISNLQNCMSEIERYNNKKSKHGILSQKFNDLLNSTKEFKKAINILDSRKRYPTARDILNAHNPPRELLEWHAKHSALHWREIAKNRAIKEFGYELTGEAFEVYHNNFLRQLDDYGLELAKPENGTELRIRRRAHKLIEILERGRVLSMFETQTAGSEAIGSKRQLQFEMRLYGFPREYPDELRPLYVIVTKGFYINEITQFYGSAAIKLKPSVQRRTTKIMYDSGNLTSLGTSGAEDCLLARPVPFNEAGRNCFPLADTLPVWHSPNVTHDEKAAALTTFTKKDPLELATANDIRPYLEGEVQNALTIDDIERIDFSKDFDQELRRELDKIVDDDQKEALKNLLSDTEKHELENIKKKGFVAVISNILSTQRNHGKVNIELLKMLNRSEESLMQLVEDYKKNLKELLEKRGIPYSFFYTDAAVQTEEI